MDVTNSEVSQEVAVRSGLALTLSPAPVFRELVGYFLVSLLALTADMTCYIALIKLVGIHYLYASVYGFLLGIWANYVGSICLVFRSRQLKEKPVDEFASFLAIGIAVWMVSTAFIYMLVEWAGVDPVLAKWSAVGLSFCLNFGLRKILLFSERQSAANG